MIGRKFLFLGAIISLVIVVFLNIKFDPVEALEDSPLDSILHPYLEKKLSLFFSSPLHYQLPKQRTIIYIMGGDETSLQSRFMEAARLFHSEKGERIWLYIQPGITAFDQTLSRNITNIEWARKLLTQLNIAANNIYFVDFEEGFWGTLSESRQVLEQAGQQGYDHINVVTSVYHTRRTWLTFSSFSEEKNISFTIYAAEDVTYLRYLLKEYGKLLIYQYILLPFYVYQVI